MCVCACVSVLHKDMFSHFHPLGFSLSGSKWSISHTYLLHPFNLTIKGHNWSVPLHQTIRAAGLMNFIYWQITSRPVIKATHTVITVSGRRCLYHTIALTSRRRGESVTLRAVGPVLSNSMFMVLPFITHTDGAAQATSTRKYHHAPSPLLIGALVPSLWCRATWRPTPISVFASLPLAPRSLQNHSQNQTWTKTKPTNCRQKACLYVKSKFWLCYVR